ncbi:MAG: hypothetical protein ACLP1X_26870, partial [Polyangiaceae bacterium]
TTVRRRDGHPDYVAAKSVDREAAVRIACDLLSDAAVAIVRQRLSDRKPTIVPVRAIETTGINLIPDAMSHELGRRLGMPVTTALVQTNTVGHTRASGFHRLAFQPTFDGAVEVGGTYLLVDDHVGLGATLANLRGHIERHGGSVLMATTLCASRDSEVLALRPPTLQALREKHGEPLDAYWREKFGFGIDLLTEAEAGYLRRTPSLDAIRAGVAKARGG